MQIWHYKKTIKFKTVGFDGVDALIAKYDAILYDPDALVLPALKNRFVCTTNLEEIKDCNAYVIVVPTFLI